MIRASWRRLLRARLDQGPRQLDELLQGDLFGSNLSRELQPLEFSRQLPRGPILFQQFEHHLAPLRKSALDDFGESPALLRREQRTWAADQRDAGRIHVRLGEETTRRDFEPFEWFVVELNQQRKQAVIFLSGAS